MLSHWQEYEFVNPPQAGNLQYSTEQFALLLHSEIVRKRLIVHSTLLTGYHIVATDDPKTKDTDISC